MAREIPTRPIKFRAWYLDHYHHVDGTIGREYYQDKWKMAEVKSLHLGTHKIIISDSYGNHSVAIGDECILMQFTGVHDKNGAEIFEGDVVKWTLESEHWVAPVYYDNEAACFWMGVDVEDPNEGAVLNDWMRGEYEVLGNQYQHPELLTSNQIGGD